MIVRNVLVCLAACLLSSVTLATEPVTVRTTGADCIGVVTDLLPSVRKSGQILVDGAAVLQRDSRNRFRVDRDTLIRQCAEDRRVVEIRVEGA